MSFDVYIQDMENRVGRSVWDQALREAFEAHVADMTEDGVGLVLKSGDELELYYAGEHPGGMAALRDLSGPVCDFLFELIARTELFMLPAMDGTRALRARGNPRPPFPDSSLEELEIADGAELFAFLSGGFENWASFRDARASAQ